MDMGMDMNMNMDMDINMDYQNQVPNQNYNYNNEQNNNQNINYNTNYQEPGNIPDINELICDQKNFIDDDFLLHLHQRLTQKREQRKISENGV